MKAIALRSTSSRTTAVPRSRRSTVTVRAWAGDNAPWAGLLRFFVSRKELNTKDDTWPETNFKGDIARGRRPFKDGFMGQKLPSQPTEASAQAATEQQPEGDSALGYLNEAVERVVKHNFKGEASEPKWSDMGAGSRGWTGEIRNTREKKEKGGFHSDAL